MNTIDFSLFSNQPLEDALAEIDNIFRYLLFVNPSDLLDPSTSNNSIIESLNRELTGSYFYRHYGIDGFLLGSIGNDIMFFRGLFDEFLNMQIFYNATIVSYLTVQKYLHFTDSHSIYHIVNSVEPFIYEQTYKCHRSIKGNASHSPQRLYKKYNLLSDNPDSYIHHFFSSQLTHTHRTVSAYDKHFLAYILSNQKLPDLIKTNTSSQYNQSPFNSEAQYHAAKRRLQLDITRISLCNEKKLFFQLLPLCYRIENIYHFDLYDNYISYGSNLLSENKNASLPNSYFLKCLYSSTLLPNVFSRHHFFEYIMLHNPNHIGTIPNNHNLMEKLTSDTNSVITYTSSLAQIQAEIQWIENADTFIQYLANISFPLTANLVFITLYKYYKRKNIDQEQILKEMENVLSDYIFSNKEQILKPTLNSFKSVHRDAAMNYLENYIPSTEERLSQNSKETQHKNKDSYPIFDDLASIIFNADTIESRYCRDLNYDYFIDINKNTFDKFSNSLRKKYMKAVLENHSVSFAPMVANSKSKTKK